SRAVVSSAPATTAIYALSLHAALPIYHHDPVRRPRRAARAEGGDRAMTSALYDTPGPRARRRILLGSIVGGALIAAALAWMLLRSEEHTSELQSRENLVCRLLLEKKKQ